VLGNSAELYKHVQYNQERETEREDKTKQQRQRKYGYKEGCKHINLDQIKHQSNQEVV
jgi:hypothetical protein